MRRVAKLSSTSMILVKLSSSPMISVKLRSLSSVRVKYRVQVRCLRKSETCEVSEITICSELQLFTDISDNIFVVVICRMIVPSNKGILAAY